jgi:hypothetical protein
MTPPEEACTPEGLLKSEFTEGMTHGNTAYGGLVARKLSTVLEAA